MIGLGFRVLGNRVRIKHFGTEREVGLSLRTFVTTLRRRLENVQWGWDFSKAIDESWD